ncbi:MAG: DUF3540 domain-containing protein [Deltaproteobacteria bacterium]|nr:DUF3540 domain-containing protein [Deltaproteobacteria bacterium]
MNNLAELIAHDQASQEYGRIVDREGSNLVVDTASGSYRARRAASCLLDPEVGDLVLLSLSNFGDGYVLAILEREPQTETNLTFDADVGLKAGGRLKLSAKDGLDLAGAGEISLTSPTLTVTATCGEVNIERLSFWGSLLEGSLEAVKLVARSFDSILERYYQRTKRSYRAVEELDQVKAGMIDYKAKDELALRGKVTQVGAEEDVVVSGKMVHLA